MNIRVGTVSFGGVEVRGQEYIRAQFDQDLWSRMKSGDQLVLPQGTPLPKELGSHSSAAFGAR